jgi:hypothetical protein
MKYVDRVKETAIATGTGDYYMQAAVTGFRTFADGFADGDSTEYSASRGNEWETGIGVYESSTNTLQRHTVTDSSNSGNAVVWTAGLITLTCSVNASTASRIASVGPFVTVPGVLQTVVGAACFVMPVDSTFRYYQATLSVPASGSSVTFTVKKNGSSLFGGTITAGDYSSGQQNINASVVAGDRLTIDVTGVGSTIQGSGLFVRLFY